MSDFLPSGIRTSIGHGLDLQKDSNEIQLGGVFCLPLDIVNNWRDVRWMSLGPICAVRVALSITM